MSFPETIFGICQVCGADGGDDPNPSSADAVARDTSGSGVILEEYEGKMTCKQCIQRLKADEESKVASERRSEEERFRQAAGFTQTITD